MISSSFTSCNNTNKKSLHTQATPQYDRCQFFMPGNTDSNTCLYVLRPSRTPWVQHWSCSQGRPPPPAAASRRACAALSGSPPSAARPRLLAACQTSRHVQPVQIKTSRHWVNRKNYKTRHVLPAQIKCRLQFTHTHTQNTTQTDSVSMHRAITQYAILRIYRTSAQYAILRMYRVAKLFSAYKRKRIINYEYLWQTLS